MELIRLPLHNYCDGVYEAKKKQHSTPDHTNPHKPCIKESYDYKHSRPTEHSRLFFFLNLTNQMLLNQINFWEERFCEHSTETVIISVGSGFDIVRYWWEALFLKFIHKSIYIPEALMFDLHYNVYLLQNCNWWFIDTAKDFNCILFHSAGEISDHTGPGLL